MTGIFPAIEPYEHGMLAVGDGNLVYWEACGNPHGKPAVVVHGGPGTLVNGRFDFQAPIANAWTLHRAWPRAELVVVDDSGHVDDAITGQLIAATNRYAASRP